MTVLDFTAIAEPDIERSVLAACMIEPHLAEDVFHTIEPGDFSSESHRLIAEAAKDLALEGSGCDFVSVTAHLRRNEKLEQVGGVSYVSSMLDALPDFPNAVYHAKLIREASIRRKLGEVVTRARHRCLDTQQAINETITELVAETLDLVGDGQGADSGFQPLGPTVDRYLQRSFEIRDGERPRDRITTGIAPLDRRLSIEPGSLTTIAGGTGSGKTALALQCGLHAAENHGAVALFSLEVGRGQLAGRALASRLPRSVNLSSFDLAGGSYPERVKESISIAAERVRALPVFVDDKPGTTSAEMRLSLRRLARFTPVSVVIVDYLQLIRSASRNRSREREVAQISSDLLMMARETNVPVIALSQLSRQHQHEKREPALRDLRESGSLEQDANNVLLIGYPSDEDSKDRNLYVAKQRGGETFAVRVTFDKRAGVFTPIDTRFDGMTEVGR